MDMYTNVPSLLDICAYNVVEKNIDVEDIRGNERCNEKILFYHRISLLAHQKGEGSSRASFLKYLMGRGPQDHLEEISSAFLLLDFAGVVNGPISEIITQAMPPTFLLKKLTREVRELIISFYLFTCVPIDFEKLEFLCKMKE